MNAKSLDHDRLREIYRTRFAEPSSLPAHDPQLAYLMMVLPANKSSRILDAGCGDGRYSRYLASQGYSDLKAVDLFEKVDFDGVRYQTASIDALPFEDGEFDFIFSNSVIYYVEPPYKGLLEMHRVLRPGGTVFFTAHTKWSLFTIQRLIKRDILKREEMAHLRGVTFYDARYYRRVLNSLNFEIILQDGFQFSFFLHPAYRRLRSLLMPNPNVRIPEVKLFQSRSRFLRHLRSELSYHCVFAARK